MKLKKRFNDITVCFEILDTEFSIKKEYVLKDILYSLENIKFINRDKPFNELIKIQQRYPDHILVDFEPEQTDAFKYLVKIVYNFLIVTDQVKHFMVENIHIHLDNTEVILYSSELLRKNVYNNVTFSPSIRSCWNNEPNLIEKILNVP
jgi:hypothetical protein